MSNVKTCEACRGTSFEIIDGNFFCINCLTHDDVSISLIFDLI